MIVDLIGIGMIGIGIVKEMVMLLDVIVYQLSKLQVVVYYQC